MGDFIQRRNVSTELLGRSMRDDSPKLIDDLFNDPVEQKTLLEALAGLRRRLYDHLIARYPNLDVLLLTEHNQRMRLLVEGNAQALVTSIDRDNDIKLVQADTQRASLQQLLNEMNQPQVLPPQTKDDDY